MGLSFGLGLPHAPKKGGSFYAGWPLAFDFVNNKYRVGIGRGYSSSFLEQPGVTYARTGADLLSYNPVTGNWQAFAANAPALLTGAGQDIPEGTTNKCTNYNAAPTDLTGMTKTGDAAATLTVVDDTAALRAAGFGDLIDAGKMNGKVFKLDNSAGSSVASVKAEGSSGNTNTHTASALVRGSGNYRLGVENNSSLIGARLAYVRVSYTGPASFNSSRFYIEAQAGSVVYFILNQLEEKSYATNPVIVSGAAATRGAARPVVTGLSSILTPPFTLVAVANLSAIDGISRPLVRTGDGTASNFTGLTRSSGNSLNTDITAAGASQPSALSRNGYTGPRLVKTALRVRATSVKASIDGFVGGETGITVPVTDRLYPGTNAISSAQVNSPLLFVGIAPDLTDAQLQAITASNGALTDFL